MELNKIYNEDCLEGMKRIEDNSIDMILCDLPYNNEQTRASWDKSVDLEKLFKQYKRIIKDDSAIVLTGNEPFSSKVRSTFIELYKYDWKWIKKSPTGFLNCNYRPLSDYEDVMVFSKSNASTGGKEKSMKYNPQGIKQVNQIRKNSKKRHGLISNDTKNHSEKNSLLRENSIYLQKYTNYPTNIIYFKPESNYKHPTQKPVALFEYLIKTYTNEGEVVLDNCMGSGTTAVACLKTNRNFIGFELEEKYYNIALKRIAKFDKDYLDELPEEEKPSQQQLF